MPKSMSVAGLWLFVALGFATAAPAAEVIEYRGLCDASAAVALEGERFVVADDEQNTLSTFRIGQAQAEATLDLGGRFADGQEADIEGAARIGPRIYWISSHGRNKKGKPRPDRMRFFATEVVGQGPSMHVAQPAHAPYKHLLDDIAADPRFTELARAAALHVPPKAEGGLNIEGLAATPAGDLLIGFRNPLPEGRALLLPLLNPAAVVERHARPRFGDLLRLDLGHRGIRSIDWIRGRYVIAAGPIGQEGGPLPGNDFALYTWSGDAADAPRLVPGVDLADLKPEALFEIPGTPRIHVLSDDGAACKDGKAKDAPRHFRAMTIELN